MKGQWLKLILLVAAAVRIALLAGTWEKADRLFTPDSSGYAALAENLAATGRFEQAGQVEITRVPGYPLFLVPAQLFGQYAWHAAAAAQIGLDVLAVYLTFLLGWMLCDRRAGLWAAAFQAVSAVAVAASVRILSDGLFVFLLTLSVLLAVHHFRTARAWSLACSAAVAAAGCYVRPTGLLFVVVLVAVVLFRQRRWKHAGMVALIVAAALAPWIVRNGVVGDYWGFSSLPGQVAFDCQAPSLLADVEGISFREAGDRMERRLTGALQGRPASPGEQARQKRRLALEVMREHPWRYAAIHARVGLGVWLPGATDVLEIAGLTRGGKQTLQVLRRQGLWEAVRNYFGDRTWALWLCAPLVAVLGAKYMLALVAAGGRIRLRMDAARWLILLTILAYTLTVGAAGHPRYRAPVEPLLSVAAAGGILLLARWGRRGSAGRP